jgi:glutamine amidotransferase-like uncharacterized protein
MESWTHKNLTFFFKFGSKSKKQKDTNPSSSIDQSQASNMSILSSLKRKAPLAISKEKYDVMESMFSGEHIEHNDQAAYVRKMRNPDSSTSRKVVKKIKHTKEQEDKIIAKRLKKKKKKQAKKNKKTKKKQ